MRMRIVCKTTKNSEIIIVKDLGSIKLNEPLSRDYPAGSKIEQVRASSTNVSDAKTGPALRAGDSRGKNDDGKSDGGESVRDDESDAASLASESDMSLADSVFRAGSGRLKVTLPQLVPKAQADMMSWRAELIEACMFYAILTRDECISFWKHSHLQ